MKTKSLILLILLAHSTQAFDYGDLPELNLTIGTPPYWVVWDYNLQRSNSMNNPPDGVEEIEDMPFDDAWIKIFALDKTVYDTETGVAAASRDGNVLVKYDYDPDCPRSTYDWDDCTGRRYRLVDWDERLRIYANGDYEGNDPVEDYDIPDSDDTLEITAELYLEVECKKYRLRDYEINGTWYCEEDYLGRYYYDDTIEDTLTYAVPTLEPTAELSFQKLAENELEISRGRLSVTANTPFSKLDLRLGGNSLVFSRNAYDVEFYLPEYNLLRITTYRLPHVVESDLFATVAETRNNDTGDIETTIEFTLNYEDTLEVLDSRDCEITLTDLFGEEIEIGGLCGIDWKQTRINATTNERIFVHEDEVVVEALLTHAGQPVAGHELVLHYAGDEFMETTDSMGKAVFHLMAEYPENRIDIVFGGDGEYLQSSKTILIATSSSRLKALLIQVMPALLVLIISAYGVYRMLKFAGVLR